MIAFIVEEEILPSDYLVQTNLPQFMWITGASLSYKNLQEKKKIAKVGNANESDNWMWTNKKQYCVWNAHIGSYTSLNLWTRLH